MYIILFFRDCCINHVVLYGFLYESYCSLGMVVYIMLFFRDGCINHVVL